MRAIIILGLGFAALIACISLLIFPFYAVMVFAALIVATASVGFALQPRTERAVTFIGGVPSQEAALIFDNQDISADYPQLLIFAVRLRRLWLLAIVIALGITFLAIAPYTFFRQIRDVTLDSEILWAFNVGIVLFSIAAAWVRERWILRNCEYRIGVVYPWIEGYCAYEFMGSDGVWAGGSYERKPWYLAPLSNVTPVLISAQNAEWHMPATACLFHQFELLERRHIPLPRDTAEVGLIG